MLARIATIVIALAVAGGAVAQDKKRIDKAADLPRFTYKVDAKLDEIVRDDVKFRAFAKDLRRDIGFGLGVVDIKRTEIESPSDIARAIERADKVLGAGRVRYVHPDCGFWMLPRNVADGKIRALTAGRDLYLGIRGRSPN